MDLDYCYHFVSSTSLAMCSLHLRANVMGVVGSPYHRHFFLAQVQKSSSYKAQGHGKRQLWFWGAQRKTVSRARVFWPESQSVDHHTKSRMCHLLVKARSWGPAGKSGMSQHRYPDLIYFSSYECPPACLKGKANSQRTFYPKPAPPVVLPLCSPTESNWKRCQATMQLLCPQASNQSRATSG